MTLPLDRTTSISSGRGFWGWVRLCHCWVKGMGEAYAVGKYGAMLVGIGVFVLIGPSMPATLGAAETRKGATVAARTM